MFEKSIFLYILYIKNSPVVYVGKTVILVKCSFRHNTWFARSKNWWDGRGRQYNHFWAVKPHSYTQREIFLSKLHLSLSDRFIIGGYAFNFQPKSHLLADETVCKARAIGIQHANMSPKSDIRHFTWFLDVVHEFLSVSELLWTLFYYKKNVLN